jgi:hypothetical protein
MDNPNTPNKINVQLDEPYSGMFINLYHLIKTQFEINNIQLMMMRLQIALLIIVIIFMAIGCIASIAGAILIAKNLQKLIPSLTSGPD